MLVVFLTQGKNVPSSRFRVQQFLPYFRAAGIICLHLPSVPAQAYSPKTSYPAVNRILFLIFLAVKAFLRLIELPIVALSDVVFIQKEILPYSFFHFEKIVNSINSRTIFDFDDAIFLPESRSGSKKLRSLVNEVRVNKTMSIVKTVIAGNSFLANHARGFNQKVVVIPTAIDTEKYRPKLKQGDGVVIGWMGTSGNFKNLAELTTVLKSLKKREKISLKIVSNRKPDFLEELDDIIPTKFSRWSSDRELDDLQSFDIGLMPLDDNQRNRGKCGFKLLQYMSVGIACIGSPVGVNTEIIDESVNGYLANSSAEWARCLENLISNKKLRESFGKNGREKVVRVYSVSAIAPKLIEQIRATAKK